MNLVYLSYFYQIRFFTPDFLPISTAVWDPKWYHDFQGPKHKFRDKNNVLNGVRSEYLHPDCTCRDLCRGPETCKTLDPTTCDFLKSYRRQLDKIDIDRMLNNIELYMNKVGAKYPVFMVHEAPSKKCSERDTLMSWFSDNNVTCHEWQKSIIA